MRARTAALAAALVVLAHLLAAPAGAQTPADGRFGVGVQTLFRADGSLVDGGDAQLARIAAEGLSVARTDAFWAAIEPSPPMALLGRRLRWERTDPIARALARHGLRWLPVLAYATPWSTTDRSTDKAAPRSDAEYAGYAAAVAQRYGPAGAFWRANPGLPQLPVETVEIWNEPNLAAYWRRPDTPRYAGLYLAARAAIRTAAPQVRALVGGLSPYANPAGYLRAMVAARPELRGAVDGVGVHPYAPGAGKAVNVVQAIRATLRDLGMGAVPIAVTEVGWPKPNRSASAAFALPEPARAGAFALFGDAIARSDCGVDAVIPYTWTSSERDPSAQDDFFGLAGADAAPGPAGRAYLAAATRAAAGGPLAICEGGGGTSPALRLGLSLARSRVGARRCVTASVSYRALPVGEVGVRFDGPRRGARRTLETGDEGTARACFDGPGRVRVLAGHGRWAGSTLRAIRAG